jgi:hypothetical protein
MVLAAPSVGVQATEPNPCGRRAGEAATLDDGSIDATTCSMGLRVYIDHNLVQRGWLTDLLHDASLAGRARILLGEAHWYETILCQDADEIDDKFVLRAEQWNEAKLLRLARSYASAFDKGVAESVNCWFRIARHFLEHLEDRGRLRLSHRHFDAWELAVRATSKSCFQTLVDNPRHFDAASYREARWCKEGTAGAQARRGASEFYQTRTGGDEAFVHVLGGPVEAIPSYWKPLARRQGIKRPEREYIERSARAIEEEGYRTCIVDELVWPSIERLAAFVRESGIRWDSVVTLIPPAEPKTFWADARRELRPEDAPPGACLSAAIALMQIRASTSAEPDEQVAIRGSNVFDALHGGCAADADLFCTDDLALQHIFGEVERGFRLSRPLPRVVTSWEELKEVLHNGPT